MREGERLGVRGVLVLVLYVLGVVWVAALPLLVGLVLAGLVPEVGRLRGAGGGWQLLHLLWIYPVFFVVVGMLEPRAGRVRSRGRRVLARVVELVLAWLVLTVLLGVFFVHPGGAAIASAVAVVSLAPFARLLERTVPRGAHEGPGDADRPDEDARSR
jgi:hypothetical protein